MARSVVLYSLLVLGILILAISILFRIMHWPGVITIFWMGFACEILFFVTAFVEMATSRKAGNVIKMTWMFLYAAILLFSFFIFPEYSALVFFALALIYLLFGRRQFLFSAKEKEPIQFDSI